jgi:hypothetical protein
LRTSKAVSVPRRDMRLASCNSCWVALSIGAQLLQNGKQDIIPPARIGIWLLARA